MDEIYKFLYEEQRKISQGYKEIIEEWKEMYLELKNGQRDASGSNETDKKS